MGFYKFGVWDLLHSRYLLISVIFLLYGLKQILESLLNEYR